ncbi:MAG: pantoate--beta-alanine ligase [Gammaproteobacteria bacterium]
MPEVFDSVEAIRDHINQWKLAGLRVGFVPTMGNLHGGHLTLVEAAKEAADRVVVSIFVNPTQFSAGEDFDAYPRTFERDLEQLDELGVDAVFAPSTQVMYPRGQENLTFVEVPDVAHILCGEFRPGHFVGVASVVAKLFNMVPADVAVFGRKDYQQLMVIRRMVEDLNFPVEIIGAPIQREPDGLAMSSRNVYLKPDERQRANAIYQTMLATKAAVDAGDFRSESERDELEEEGRAALIKAGLQPEYYSLRNADDLAVARPRNERVVLVVAARLGAARLIDNLMIRE